VQILARAPATQDRSFAVSRPFSYTETKLSSDLRRAGALTLVSPNLRLYFPCARLPRLAHGVVQPPSVLVGYGADTDNPIDWGGSPFEGVQDLYALQDLPPTNDRTGLPIKTLDVYGVDARIPGAAVTTIRRHDT
jgi:hypothetical protein